MLHFFFLLFLQQVQQQIKSRAYSRSDAGQENNSGRVATKINQKPCSQQEYGLGTLEPGFDQVAVMPVIPGLTESGRGKLGQEQDKGTAYQLQIGG